MTACMHATFTFSGEARVVQYAIPNMRMIVFQWQKIMPACSAKGSVRRMARLAEYDERYVVTPQAEGSIPNVIEVLSSWENPSDPIGLQLHLTAEDLFPFKPKPLETIGDYLTALSKSGGQWKRVGTLPQPLLQRLGKVPIVVSFQ